MKSEQMKSEQMKSEPLLTATLDRVCRCPARSDYIELHFRTAEGEWEWCFPEPPPHSDLAAGPLALTLGRYGVLAREISGDGLGYAVESDAALARILAGAPVSVARRLVLTAR